MPIYQVSFLGDGGNTRSAEYVVKANSEEQAEAKARVRYFQDILQPYRKPSSLLDECDEDGNPLITIDVCKIKFENLDCWLIWQE